MLIDRGVIRATEASRWEVGHRRHVDVPAHQGLIAARLRLLRQKAPGRTPPCRRTFWLVRRLTPQLA
jgi:hypothetical protein